MEILISIVISIFTELLKKLSTKLGYEMTTKFVSFLVLLFCFIGAVLYTKGIVTWEMVNKWLQIALIAVGYYEVVYKQIVVPAFNKLKQ